MARRTLVVIPAFNEEQSIRQVVEGALRCAEVCVVDDGSRDRTKAIVESIPGASCLAHPWNRHIPQSLLDGMRYGLERHYDYIVTMDAGLSHAPEDLPRLVNAAPCGLLIGVRTHRRGGPLLRRLLSRSGTALINLALRSRPNGLPSARFSDATSGFRRYSREAVALIMSRQFRARSFDFHTEALMFAYRNGLTIAEVPISYKFTTSSLNARVVMDSAMMFFNILCTNRM